MKTFLTIVLFLGVLFVSGNSLQAQIVITVNGQPSGASLAQSDTLNWIITGLPSGATVMNQIWIDVDSNGVINPVSDIFFVSFPQTDGVAGGDGPSDGDGIANGTISTILPGISFPVQHYIIKTSTGTDSASATFTITIMTSPTYSISGTVTKSSVGVPKVVMRAQISGMGKIEYYGLTDAIGNYTILTNVISGTVMRVEVPTGDFNSSIGGFVATPSSDTITLTANVTGINFVLTDGKIITGFVHDTTGNPLSNINISANIPMGSTYYNGRTDAAGAYTIAVPIGSYQIQFGNQDQTNGYVVTYYNQKYVSWLTDTIHITSLTDTVKNVNAVLRKGGVITGTVANAGFTGWNITAFQYGVPGVPLFAQFYNNSGIYHFTVLPGTYSIQFNINGGSTQFYYNQMAGFPGTAVTVTAIGDTTKNIDADFTGPITEVTQIISEVPKEFLLLQNYPNPFNPSTEIRYQLPKSGYVTLKVYNVLGKEIETLVNGEQPTGSYTTRWNASQYSSGIYFYKLQAGSFTATKKLVLMK